MEKANLVLLLFFPLCGVLINGFLGKKLPKSASGIIACAAVGFSFLWTVYLFFALESSTGHHAFNQKLFTWISTGKMNVDFALLFDPLSCLMCLIITGVGFLIHLYSVDYMSEDENVSRYFTYLNLFVFSMLILVLGDNFLLLFVGWELVGLCSYLLIGFWFTKQPASDAGKKAFLVNRVGDFGFLIGLFLIFAHFNTFDFHAVFENAVRGATARAVLVPITLFLFIGACGKSAQIPLYVWLPDAMEGPSPVSALIHAATMVTAGVYMIVRCHVLFVLSPDTLSVVAAVGGVTAFFAATMALVQYDIKRILAYSTISQLGYMFLACGCSAFTPAMFHLTTHAFFKALLFLGAGSVMHALSGETDIRKMGMLSRHLPVTTKTFLIGSLSLAGIVPFSGFFSKDEILASVILSGNQGLWLLAVATVLLTAFYTFRLMFTAFYSGNESAESQPPHAHIHEAPPRMAFALVALALLSSAGGFLNLPEISFLKDKQFFHHFLQPVFSDMPEIKELVSAEIELKQFQLSMLSMFFSLGVALMGLFTAILLYLKKDPSVMDFFERLKKRLPPVASLLQHKYYVDEIYFHVFVYPGRWLSEVVLWKIIDIGIIDSLVHIPAFIARSFGSVFRTLQTGFVRSYALIFSLGVCLLFYLFVLK